MLINGMMSVGIRYVLLTMMDAHETPQTKRLRVMERSVYSARYVYDPSDVEHTT